LLDEQEIVAVTLLYLVVVLLASALWGYAVGLVTALVANFLLNVFFVPPLHTITVRDPSNVVALVLFLAVAVVGGSMLALLRRQLALAEERRAELSIMLELSRELATARTPDQALEVLAWSIQRAFHARRCEILEFDGREWRMAASTGPRRTLTRDQTAVCLAAVESGDVARRMSDTRDPAASVGRRTATETYLPFGAPEGRAGVIHLSGPLTVPAGGELHALLRAFGDEAGVAIHRARLAEQAHEAEAIRRSDDFKSALLSSVSHDLRSPLTAIKAAVGTLLSDQITLEERDRCQLLEAIESQTDRLATTVAELLEMSRLEGGAVNPTVEAIEVHALLADAASQMRSIVAGRELRVEGAEGLWARGDYGLLLQALVNLVENASNYSVPGGAIELRALRVGPTIVIEVADEGPGISAEDLPRVFDRFYRGSASKGVQGTGLGLAIVRAMVELCEGAVTVDSSPAGTTFRITLQSAAAPR